MCDEVGVYDRVEEVVVHCVIDVRILVVVAPKHTFCLFRIIRGFITAGDLPSCSIRKEIFVVRSCTRPE